MTTFDLHDSTETVEVLAAASETTPDADLREAYQHAARAVYDGARHGAWWPDDYPLLAALARHAHRHRGHPETGGLTHTQEGT